MGGVVERSDEVKAVIDWRSAGMWPCAVISTTPSERMDLMTHERYGDNWIRWNVTGAPGEKNRTATHSASKEEVSSSSYSVHAPNWTLRTPLLNDTGQLYARSACNCVLDLSAVEESGRHWKRQPRRASKPWVVER